MRPEVLPEALGYLSSMLQTRSYVVDVREAGTRISGIVRDTKEYTNLDRAPEREVDVRLGIETTLAMLRPQLAGITVVQRHAPDVPAIQGYPGELNQVWTNLIDNAADALDGRGELVITVRREGACVLVEVADDGPGVPAEILPRLFEPFFTTKDIGVGTGLGLHLTHRIVTQRHRGSIVVRSRPGDTRFQVRLPIDGGAGCESPVSGG
ncbi:sensor histidine kinase [Planomonospora algeriensis]